MSESGAGARRRRRAIRRCAPSGTSPRRCSRPSTTGLLPLRRLHQARRVAPAGAVPHPEPRRLRRVRAAGARPAVLLRAGRAGRAPACACRACAAARAAYGLPVQTPTDYSLSVLGRFDPAVLAPRQEAHRRRQGSLVGDRRRRDAPHRRAGRAVRPGRRLAAQALPLRRTFAAELQGAVVQTQRRTRRRRPHAGDGGGDRLLYLEAALEDGDFDDPDARRPRAAPGRAPRRRAPAAAARAARELDGGAVPARLRPPDHGQRRPGAARLAERGREGDRPVLPQPGRTPASLGDVPAQLVVDARRALGARPGPGVAGAAAHARRGRRPGLDRGRSGDA